MVQVRKRTRVLTDPLRRVYWGVPFSSKEVWTEWGDLCPFRDPRDAEVSAASWRLINPQHEYRVVLL
jgi:hypothetical protein